MIKDVMVRLDGTSGDDVRLAAVSLIAEIFGSHVTGLLFNVLPPPPIEVNLNGADAKLLDTAKQAGDAVEATVFERLTRLQQPTNLRRFDVIGDEIPDTALPLARAADTFVALRPNDRSNEPQGLIENLLSEPAVIFFSFLTTGKPWRQWTTSLWRVTGVGARARRIASLSASGEKSWRSRRGKRASNGSGRAEGQ
jgi:citrate lyase gamma subunit